MIYLHVICLLVWAAFARWSAREEVAFTWPFRELSDAQGFREDRKFELTRTFHRNGAAYVVSLAAMTGLLIAAVAYLQGASYLVAGITGTASTLAYLATYWWRFDIHYANGIGKAWWYIGDTADLDKYLKRLGNNSGRIKAYICGIGIALLSGLIYIIN